MNHCYEPRRPPTSSKTPDETSIDRSTGTHQISPAPHHLHRKRLQNRRFYFRRASIARTRSHLPPLITNTEKKASHKPSPNTTGERQSSSDASSSIKTNPKSQNQKLKNPKTKLGKAMQGKEHLHLPETKAGESRAEEASTSREQSRRWWICRSRHLPETKPNLTSRLHPPTLHTIASLLQTHRHQWCRFTPWGDDDEGGLDQSSDKAIGRESVGEAGKLFNGRAKGSCDGTLAHAPAVRRTQDRIYFFSLDFLSSLVGEI